LFEHTISVMDITWPQLLQASDRIITQQVSMQHRYYVRNGVQVVHGRGRLLDPHHIEVTRSDGSTHTLEGEYIIIATGSRPWRPPELDFDDPRIHDSDTILELEETPRKVTIFGAGVIGCEYASIFANLDVKVNLVNTRERLLSFLDDEVTDALSYHLRDQGVLLLHNESLAEVTSNDHEVTLTCQSGRVIRSDILLWANGRSGNTTGMGLEELGIKINRRGQIETNEYFQSNLPHIYAVGDVAGPPGLASAAYDQGRFVGAHIADGKVDWSLVKEVPTGIYTSPEISSLGRTEAELTRIKVPFEVGRAEFKNLARAQISGHTTGMLKILFHRKTLEILGIHCIGQEATEIIHIGQAIMSQPGNGNNLRYFAETTFNYPTMAEAYRVAALYGLNRIS
ncbi:MAG TPA: Si-specific NAD(P)(+) transhydrogenase, partial [Chromatiaceae bacterium]|nr:Si-specific NAD(P)(+) transhydrogenase [Chromatiaceae bacterium]